MRALLKCCLFLLLGVLPVACGGSLFKTELPASDTYRLAPVTTEGAAAQPLDAVLLVTRPVIAPGLDTERIAVMKPDRRLDYFAASEWGAPAPDVIQDVIVASLQNTGRLRGVQRDLSNFRPDFVLQLDVRAFEAHYTDGAAPKVRVDFIATIGRLNDRQSVASFPVVAEEQATANSMTSVSAAFDKSLQSATRDLLAQVIEYVGRMKGATPAAAPASPAQ